MEPTAIVPLAFVALWVGIPTLKYILARRAMRDQENALAEAAAEASKPEPDPEPTTPAPQPRKPLAAEKSAVEDAEAVWRRLAHVPALLRARPDRWAEVQREVAAASVNPRRRSGAVQQMLAAAIAEIEELASRELVSSEWANRMILRLRFVERDLDD